PRGVHRPAQGRHRRPGQGDAQRPAKRRQRRLLAAHHRIARCGRAAEDQERDAPRRTPRHGWHGWHGWHGRYGWYGRHGWHGLVNEADRKTASRFGLFLYEEFDHGKRKGSKPEDSSPR